LRSYVHFLFFTKKNETYIGILLVLIYVFLSIYLLCFSSFFLFFFFFAIISFLYFFWFILYKTFFFFAFFFPVCTKYVCCKKKPRRSICMTHIYLSQFLCSICLLSFSFFHLLKISSSSNKEKKIHSFKFSNFIL